MKSFESEIQSKDGQRLFVRGWEPEGKPRGVLVLMHGLGEHTGRYAHVAEALTKAGYALAGFDLRGHGRTPGPRGYAPSFEAIMRDFDALFALLRQRYGEQILYVQYGHSLGGVLTVAYHCYAQPRVAGLVITAPGFASPVLEQKGKVMLVKVLGSLLPKMVIDTGLDVNGISRDPRVIRAYTADPLTHEKSSLSFARAGFDAIDFALQHASELNAPLLLMHGTADPLTYPRGSQDFVGRVSSKDVTFKTWEGLYHELHNEPEQAEVLQTMISWLDAHVPSGRPAS